MKIIEVQVANKDYDNKGYDFIQNLNKEKNEKRLRDKYKDIEAIEIDKKFKNTHYDKLQKIIDKTEEDLIHLTKKEFLNIDSGLILTMSKANLHHSLNHYRSEIKTNIHYELEKLIMTSLFLGKDPPNEYRKDIIENTYKFINAAKIDNKQFVVKLIALRYLKENGRISHYGIDQIEIEPVDTKHISTSDDATGASPLSTTGSSPFVSTRTKISIDDLLYNVNKLEQKRKKL